MVAGARRRSVGTGSFFWPRAARSPRYALPSSRPVERLLDGVAGQLDQTQVPVLTFPPAEIGHAGLATRRGSQVVGDQLAEGELARDRVAVGARGPGVSLHAIGPGLGVLAELEGFSERGNVAQPYDCLVGVSGLAAHLGDGRHVFTSKQCQFHNVPDLCT